MHVASALWLALGLASLGQNPGWPAKDAALSPNTLARREHMPDDPGYAPQADCSGQLGLYSFTPTCTPSLAALDSPLGTGIHADRAWLLTTGRPDVTLAILGEGVDWADPDLVSRWRLNEGELPAPEVGGSAAKGHDRNGDGAFTVLDYTTATGTAAPSIARIADERLLLRADKGDANGNGILDPQDLLRIFGDGVDDDGDGYTDDVAGWDFLEDDPDPSEPSRPGGARPRSAFARTAAATANNGAGVAGVCPRCTLIAARVASASIAPSIAAGEAMIFAVSRGARAIGIGVEPAGGGPLLDDAVGFARAADTLVIAGAGTSGSPHPTSPWDPQSVLIVGSIGFDHPDPARATRALAPDPCSGWGTQIAVAAPGRCDDQPLGLALGTAGLVLSAAAGLPERNVPALEPALSAAELAAILKETADPSPRARPPSSERPERWDPRLGFGRINARAAVDAVVRRTIPPEISFVAPLASALLDPSRTGELTVLASIASRRRAGVTWVLEAAAGLAPSSDAFTLVASGSLEEVGPSRIEARLVTDGLFRDPTAPPEQIGDGMITLRLTATAQGGAVRQEARRVVLSHRDLYLFPAYPLALGARAAGSPRVVDLDEDGTEELVVATLDGTIHVLDARGQERAGWPVRAPMSALLLGRGAPFTDNRIAAPREEIASAPSVARFRGPADERTVIALTTGGVILALDPRGQPRPGFPVSISAGPFASPVRHRGFVRAGTAPVLADLDGNGALDVVAARGDGRIVAVDMRGQPVRGFPIDLGEMVGPLAAGDVDRDGRADLVAASARTVWLIRGDGTAHADGPFHKGWPVSLDPEGVGPDHPIDPPSPILIGARPAKKRSGLMILIARSGRDPVLLEPSGARAGVALSTARDTFGSRSSVDRDGEPIVDAGGAPAAADLDHDGALDLLTGGAPAASLGRLGPAPGSRLEPSFAAWSLVTGRFLEGFPIAAGDRKRGGFLVADLDGDGRDEVIAGDASHRLYAFSSDGRSPRGWPKLTTGFVPGSPAAGDLDGDGNLDVAAVGHDGVVLVWRTTGRALGQNPWDGERHDLLASGNLETPTIARGLDPSSKGCGCASTARGGSGAGLLVLVLLLLARASSRGPSR